jgi:hypothetical protein
MRLLVVHCTAVAATALQLQNRVVKVLLTALLHLPSVVLQLPPLRQIPCGRRTKRGHFRLLLHLDKHWPFLVNQLLQPTPVRQRLQTLHPCDRRLLLVVDQGVVEQRLVDRVVEFQCVLPARDVALEQCVLKV